MAHKTLLGIDIGHESLKLALLNGNKIQKTVVVHMPDHMVKDGKIVSIESMAALIRETMKNNKMKASQAALVLSSDQVFLRNVTMAVMTHDQLMVNLPYEFRDYITDELSNYIFDYAMITPREQLLAKSEGERPESMELMAVAVPAQLIEDARNMIRKAGMKLVIAAPAVSAYLSLIHRHVQECGEEIGEIGIIDLGYQSIRMHIFHGDSHQVTRELEMGLASLNEAIADYYNVDVHLAHTYMETNHNHCLESAVCEASFANIAVELMRAINFYRFSNPDSELEKIYLCGGGASIEKLRTAIEDNLNIEMKTIEELYLIEQNVEEGYRQPLAIGITLE